MVRNYEVDGFYLDYFQFLYWKLGKYLVSKGIIKGVVIRMDSNVDWYIDLAAVHWLF